MLVNNLTYKNTTLKLVIRLEECVIVWDPSEDIITHFDSSRVFECLISHVDIPMPVAAAAIKCSIPRPLSSKDAILVELAYASTADTYLDHFPNPIYLCLTILFGTYLRT